MIAQEQLFVQIFVKHQAEVFMTRTENSSVGMS
jgi:hypothetical protein